MAGIRINILSNFNASGFDKLQRELKRVDTPMEKLGATTRALAPAAKIGLAALAVGATKTVTSANDLALGLREVVTLTGDTGDEANKTFGEMQGLVRDVSNEFAIAQTELTGGLYQALSAGIPKENALEFMRIASKAAVAGVTDVETSVDGLSTIINAFGLETDQAQEVADGMFAAVKGGKTNFEELSAAMFNAAPAAAAAGVKFSEVLAATATLTAAGTPTKVAMTQIRAALTGLQKPSKDLDAIFQNLGFDSAQLAIEQEGLGFALSAVKDASGGSTGELKRLLGSVEAVAAANVIAGTGAEKFAEEMERQANAANSVDDAFSEIDKSRTLEKQRIAFENMGIAIGNVLIPVMEILVPMFTGFADFVAQNSVVFTILAGVLGAVAIAILAVNFALNANPIAKVITAIGILIGLIVFFGDMLLKHMGGADVVFKALKDGMAAVGEFFGTVFQGISDFFVGVFELIKIRFENFVNTVIAGLNRIIDLANAALGLVATVTGGAIDIRIPTIPEVKLPRAGNAGQSIPRLALGGIVMPRPGGVLANLAEAGQPEAVIPLDRMGDFTRTKATSVYNITVNGGLESSSSIGKRVVEAIKAYERTSGPVFAGA